jgi:DNA helicase II / ATP-dependent DNA helicase PcrA
MLHPLKSFIDNCNNPALKIELRNNLTTLLHTLRDKRKLNKNLGIVDLIQEYDLMIANDIQMINTIKVHKSKARVELLTAHKSKGMEFENVIILHANDNVWIPRNISQKIRVPLELGITPDPDLTDDKLRLFYVAITRAKENLIFTRFQHGQGKNDDNIPVQFLANSNIKFEEKMVKSEDLSQLQFRVDNHIYDLDFETKEYVKPLLDGYKMSVTHLNNFLNIPKGGPNYFFETNILQFPHRMDLSSINGSVVHYIINFIYKSIQNHRQLLYDWTFEDDIKPEIVKELSKYDLNITEYHQGIEFCISTLEKYWRWLKKNINPFDRTEVDFKNENCYIGDALITGKIDRLHINKDNNEITVTDFKTGSELKKWEDKDDYKNAKANRFKRQLWFYKVLIENSRRYKDFFKATNGVIEFVQHFKSDGSISELNLDLTDNTEYLKIKKLIEVVYSKIINLDFPDITKYPESEEGIDQFIDDLVNNRV